MRTRKKIEILLVFALLLAILAVLLVSALLFDHDETMRRFASLNASLVLILIALASSNYLFRIVRWHRLACDLGVRVPLADTAIIYLAGFSMGITPGKVGEALRLWLLEYRFKIPYERSAPLFIGDRMGDIYAMLLLCQFGLTVFSGYLPGVILLVIFTVLLTWLFARPGPLIILVSFGHALSGRRFPRLFARIRRTLRLTERVFEFRRMPLPLFLGICAWFAECFAFYWLLLHMGIPLQLNQAVFIYAFASLGGALSMLPGGLGGFEAIAVGLLLLSGTSPAAALTAVAVIRFFTLWYSIIVGFAFLPAALNKKNRLSCDT